ncbi:hypothetical protein V6615_14945 [Oscillospiraceae bacterium PP1C4]
MTAFPPDMIDSIRCGADQISHWGKLVTVGNEAVKEAFKRRGYILPARVKQHSVAGLYIFQYTFHQVVLYKDCRC